MQADPPIRLKIKVSCSSDFIGNCARAYTDAWDTALQGKAFDAIANVKPLEMQPLTVTAKLPSPPDFKKPVADDKATESAKSLDKGGLAAAAKVAAYDRFKAVYEKMKKPDDPAFSVRLEEFLNWADKQPDPKHMRDFAGAVVRNSMSTMSLINRPKKGGRATIMPEGIEEGKHVARAMEALAAENPPNEAYSTHAIKASAASAVTGSAASDYEPIGVWISNWSDIFPWLATGFLNAIVDTSKAESIIKFRMIQQDFLTLGRLYRYASSLNLAFKGEPNFTPGTLVQIADDFSSQCDKLRKIDTARQDYGQAAADAYNHLGDAAKAIYRLWDAIGFLRNCELGLGVLKEDGLSPVTHTVSLVPEGDLQYSNDQNCSFNQNAKNWAAFAQFQKLLPLILPSGKILAFGPSGILAKGITHIFSIDRSGLIRRHRHRRRTTSPHLPVSPHYERYGIFEKRWNVSAGFAR